MPRPTKPSELAQAIYVARWLAVTIPKFSEVRDDLDKVMRKLANKPKKVLKQKAHKLQWMDEGIRSWNRFKTLLEISSRHYDKELLVLTDTSKYY